MTYEYNKTDLACSQCGKAMVGNKNKKWCSGSCRAKACRKRAGKTNRRFPLPVIVVKYCEECKQKFIPSESNVRFCSISCGAKASARKRPKTIKVKEVKLAYCDICGTLTQYGRKYCSEQCSKEANRQGAKAYYTKHYRNEERYYQCVECGKQGCSTWKAAKFCCVECSIKSHKRDRRARKRNAFVEHVYAWQLIIRDNGICQICHKPIDLTANVPHPLAPTVDHIIALVNGGEHSYRNCQLAHFICNSIKGDR